MSQTLTAIEKLAIEMRGWIHAAEDFGFDIVELLGEEKFNELESAEGRSVLANKELEMTDEEARKFVEYGLNECADRFIREVDRA